MNVPVGWKLVPIKITPEMGAAMANARGPHSSSYAAPQWEAALAAAPTPPAPEVSVTQEDANNYCRILSLLGMEEEGDPVAEVERLLSVPPAPEVEPAIWIIHDAFSARVGYEDDKARSEQLIKAGYKLTPLYTHPTNDGLRKAAEEACTFLEGYCDAIETLSQKPLPLRADGIKAITTNLRAELEKV